jgi:protein-S-isoprenylcysteine O-methyltransferase Ste14
VTLRTRSIVSFVLLVVTLLVLIERGSILADSVLFGAAQIIAVAIMVWARVTFGHRSFHAGANPTEGGLVTTGPYRYIRHPIYASILLFIWAGVLSHLSFIDAMLAVAATGFAFLRLLAEEHLVQVRYPEYTEYAARTKRLIPFLY